MTTTHHHHHNTNAAAAADPADDGTAADPGAVAPQQQQQQTSMIKLESTAMQQLDDDASLERTFTTTHVSGGGGAPSNNKNTVVDADVVAGAATSEKRLPKSNLAKHCQQQQQQPYSCTVLCRNVTNNTHTSDSTTSERIMIGKPIWVSSSHSNFPSLGSQLGPLFCLGRLGRGTFCSIHKCIQLHYYNDNNNQQRELQPTNTPSTTTNNYNNNNNNTSHRIAVAKVELETFQNSGVLDGEAVVLQHLDLSLPPGTVPKYMGYYKTTTNTTTTSSSAPASTCAAIVMEYLPGEDMHQLRDRVVYGRPSRRIAIQDAVYLTADVMLPLLQRMHMAGIVHRDVKPSNVVRCSNAQHDRQFCMVDFGLSKSIVVPAPPQSPQQQPPDSAMSVMAADYDHPFHGISWIRPPLTTMAVTTTTTDQQQQQMANPNTSSNGVAHHHNGNNHHHDNDTTTIDSTASACAPTTAAAYLRKERPIAEFRGTSMYASLRVHQLKDYAPRDDMWSLLYVFCDLVSGGLPWMSHAANRDRDACQKLKEVIHGEDTNSTSRGSNSSSSDQQPPSLQQQQQTDQRHRDETHQLLMGDLYHLAKYKRDHHNSRGRNDATSTEPVLPEPLQMSKDEHKVQLLRTAFAHLATLQFWDIPDYDLIQRCIQGFLPSSQEELISSLNDDDLIPPIHWEHFPSKPSNKYRRNDSSSTSIATALLRRNVPTWNLTGPDSGRDVLDEDLFDESEATANAGTADGISSSSVPLEGEEADLANPMVQATIQW